MARFVAPAKHLTPREIAVRYVALPELQVVPPCRICGVVPVQYCRFDSGEVQHLTGQCVESR